ncbi:TetR/AcrR family transcriptional regulator [Leptospira selangorensis]|uniref:TetR/AcrR family transcriptional regulator n=1 Tax=Leptospira selangorensis TaxID=2484982 RepID=A0A5F2BYE0_9LEPT|nr:TetR/AcrR family transcriptional regulator [Leptospira selangorensis]TGM16269.1 TetR/AcrR family transcriptional regulator [Leptospira selangorensis]TGM17780.1 TetR/AcrR family transcriptional regulator [Leptospira selangorensis]
MDPKKKIVRNPVQDRSIARKENLIEAAYKLVKRNGYDETGIRDIVEEAGVSIGTFYAYYKDKNDIALEVIRKYSEEFYGNLAAETISSLPENADMPRIILEILTRMRKSALKNKKLHKEFAILSLADQTLSIAVKKIERERIGTEVFKLIQYFGKNRKLRSEPASFLIAQRAMDDIVTYMVLQGFDIPDDKILEETAIMIGKYLEVS